MKKIIKNESGAISIFTVMILAVVIPLAILVGLELPKMYQSSEKVKEAVDISASSVITQVSSSGFSDGQIMFDGSDTVLSNTAKQMFAVELGIQYNPETGKFEIPEKSNVIDVDVDVQLIDEQDINLQNNVDGVLVQSQLDLSEKEKLERTKTIQKMIVNGASPQKIEEEKKRWDSSWSRMVKKASVVVEAKVTFKKVGFIGRDYTVNKYGMSQANINLDNLK